MHFSVSMFFKDFLIFVIEVYVNHELRSKYQVGLWCED